MRTVYFTILLCTLIVAPIDVFADKTDAHDRYGLMLLQSKPKEGGCASLSVVDVNNISRWMDNPATRTGGSFDKSTHVALNPRNHAYQRHTYPLPSS